MPKTLRLFRVASYFVLVTMTDRLPRIVIYILLGALQLESMHCDAFPHCDAFSGSCRAPDVPGFQPPRQPQMNRTRPLCNKITAMVLTFNDQLTLGKLNFLAPF